MKPRSDGEKPQSERSGMRQDLFLELESLVEGGASWTGVNSRKASGTQSWCRPGLCFVRGIPRRPMNNTPTAVPRFFSFVGGASGEWRVKAVNAYRGETLPAVESVAVKASGAVTLAGAAWVLRGITSNERYVTREEKTELVARQPGIGRAEARLAALIPIRKSPEWWTLTQDERRAIFEEQSAHVRIGMKFLPAIARRLHHCRDLGPDEPFDFLTWFEYSVADAAAFDDLLAQLRASPEWKFVSREVDVRLERAEG